MAKTGSSKTLDQLHQSISEYQMPSHAEELIGSGEVLVLCGVTAAGKNTIINHLVESDKYTYVVSHTTRKPRSNDGVPEQNGQQYWFVSPDKMLSMVQNQEFVEVKAVFGETCYGTSIQQIDQAIDEGSHPVMEIDVQGVLELVEAVPNLRPLFVLPPNFSVWMERMQKRGGLTDDAKRRRIETASLEIQTALDHPSFVLVVNHEFQDTILEITQGVDVSERAQTERRQVATDILARLKSA